MSFKFAVVPLPLKFHRGHAKVSPGWSCPQGSFVSELGRRLLANLPSLHPEGDVVSINLVRRKSVHCPQGRYCLCLLRLYAVLTSLKDNLEE